MISVNIFLNGWPGPQDSYQYEVGEGLDWGELFSMWCVSGLT